MDIMFIKGLTVMAVIGVYNWERRCLQKLVFDLDISCDNRVIAYYDNIQYCYNYQSISDFVCVLMKTRSFFLLEAVAEHVATELISVFKLSWIRVKVDKPGSVLNTVGVGVIIERTGCTLKTQIVQIIET